MLTVLENDYLKVAIAKKGAELRNIIHKQEGFDYLWQGAEGYWSKQAPNLFPIVGRLNENKYLKAGKVYEMNQHGFARDLDFEVVDVSNQTVTFSLQENTETLERYPYKFQLKITYQLEGNQLMVSYQVENNSDEEMPYSLGGHPAFHLPINGEGVFEDYQLQLSPVPEKLDYFEMDPPPYLSGRKLPLDVLNEGATPINRDLFGAGLVMDTQGFVKQATLTSTKSKHSISLEMGDFPYLCLWTEEGVEAPFVCVEPFHGVADEYGPVGALSDKRGINSLAVSESRTHQFAMKFT